MKILEKIFKITNCEYKNCKYRLCHCCDKCVRNKTLEVKDFYSPRKIK